MFYYGFETASIMPKLVGIFDVFISHKTLRNNPIIEWRSGWRTIYQELGKLWPKVY